MKCPNCKCEIINSASVCPYCGFDIYGYTKGITTMNMRPAERSNRGRTPQNENTFTYGIRTQTAANSYGDNGTECNTVRYAERPIRNNGNANTVRIQNTETVLYLKLIAIIGVILTGIEFMSLVMLIISLIK